MGKTETNRYKIIETTAATILDVILGYAGGELLERFNDKRKIKKILKQDEKNIQEIFHVKKYSDKYNLLEQFIFRYAFSCVELYSVTELNVEQQDVARKLLKDFCKDEGLLINNMDFEKIIRCINLHNKSINNLIMSEQDKIQIKIHQKNHDKVMRSLETLMDTLNTKTNLHENDDKLDFLSNQIESIVKSLRMELAYLRRMQLIYIISIFVESLFFFKTVFMALDDMNMVSVLCLSLMVFLLILLMLLSFFLTHVFKRIRIIEKKVDEFTAELWNIHIKIYDQYVVHRVFEYGDYKH